MAGSFGFSRVGILLGGLVGSFESMFVCGSSREGVTGFFSFSRAKSVLALLGGMRDTDGGSLGVELLEYPPSIG